MLAIGCGGSVSPVEDSRKHFRQGQEYLSQYNLSEAIKEFKYALRLNPDLIEAYYALGVAYQRIGMLAEAKEHFEAYLKYHPDHKDTQLHLLDIYYDYKMTDEAIQKGQFILSYDPDNAHVHDVLGKIFLYKQVDYLAAKYHYTQLTKNESMAQEAYFKLVEISLRTNQPAEAENFLQQILANDPKNLKAYQTLIKIYDDSGRADDSIPLYEKVVELKPDDMAVRVTLMNLCIKNNLFDKAKEQALQIVKIDPQESTSHFALGKIYLNQGEYAKALEQFEIARKSGFKLNETLEYLGNIAYKLRKWDEAEEAYKVLLVTRPDLFEVRRNLTLLYLRSKKWQQAEASANELACRFYGLDEAYLYTGLAMFEQSNIANSIDNLQKFFNPVGNISPAYQLFLKKAYPQTVKPKDSKSHSMWNEVVGHYLMGFCYLWQGQSEAAVKQFSLAIQAAPGFVEPSIGFAIACHELGQYQKAHEFAQRTLRVSPNDPLIPLVIANIYASQGDLVNAQKYMNKANGAIEEFKFPLMDITKNTAAGKPNSLSHLSLSVFCYQYGLRNKAVEESKYVLKYSPENPLAQYIVDNTYMLILKYYKESGPLRIDSCLDKIMDLPVIEENLKEAKGEG